jgi:hypothetical protein
MSFLFSSFIGPNVCVQKVRVIFGPRVAWLVAELDAPLLAGAVTVGAAELLVDEHALSSTATSATTASL